MQIKIIAVCLLFLLAIPTYSQHQDVFPSLTGQELLDNLKDSYKSNIPLTQAVARDTLFGVIDNQNDSLTCVYTGFTIWLDPTLDPTQAAFVDENNPDAINTEHTYPKANGATGKAEGDLHHLYPTRKDVNADRSNYPFAEIPDNETENWYYQSQSTSSIPGSNIDLYSEKRGFEFEPPEAHKGNVARAMFYFYTMYKEQADMANADYFETQRQTLCAWHFQDPVDLAEWERTWKIAEYQEGIPNPFVLDCTLPERSYCQNAGMTCTPTPTDAEEAKPIEKETSFVLNRIVPNPMRTGATFYYTTRQSTDVRFEILNVAGERVYELKLGKRAPGAHQFFWDKPQEMAPGTAICKFTFTTPDGQSYVAAGKMVIL